MCEVVDRVFSGWIALEVGDLGLVREAGSTRAREGFGNELHP